MIHTLCLYTLYFITMRLLRVRFDSLQTTTTNHLYICRRFNVRYFVRCTSSIHFKVSTLLQAARLRRYAGRCSLRLWRQSTFAHCSQEVLQIFTATVRNSPGASCIRNAHWLDFDTRYPGSAKYGIGPLCQDKPRIGPTRTLCRLLGMGLGLVLG